MGTSYATNPLIFILQFVQFVFEAYILVVLLRFFLQLTRADFYNPLSQFIVKVTSPVLVPLRRMIPPAMPSLAPSRVWSGPPSISFSMPLSFRPYSAGSIRAPTIPQPACSIP